jgi:nucleoside phosphorylase
MDRVDVLVIAALREEFDAAEAAGLAITPAGPGVLRWEERDLDGIPPFLWGEYRADGKARFTLALARPTQMGGRATGPFAASLVDRLRPASLAMCGVCAGNPTDTALGDVVVGEPVYEWDEGKQSVAGFEGDHRQFRLEPRWLRAAQDFDPSSLASYGDASEDEALLWFLEQLHRGQQPRSHPSRDAYFPSGTWQPRLAQIEKQGLIRREPTGEAVLTSDGVGLVQRRLYDDVDGPQQLPFRVLAAPMASGSAVIADPDVWIRLKAMGMRKITAVEMEAATIATVAHDRRLPWLVAKGVMDHADTRKDDRYKQFAARASAQVMFALLERLVAKTDTGTQRMAEMVGTPGISSVSGRGGAGDSRASVAEPARVDVASLLDELAAGDPVPDDSARTNGRLYLVVHPVDAAADALAGVSTMSATGDLEVVIRQAVAARGGPAFSPDLGSGMWRRRSSGLVKENGIREDGSVRENSLLGLKIQENGTVGLLCGRATDMAHSQWRPLGSTAAPAEHRVILPSLVLGLVHGTLRVAADLARNYAGYDGPWVIGLRLTGIKTAIAYEYVQSGDEDVAQPYDVDSYQKTTTASTADLLRTPEVLTEQLVGALLRGLSVDKRYLPYGKSE